MHDSNLNFVFFWLRFCFTVLLLCWLTSSLCHYIYFGFIPRKNSSNIKTFEKTTPNLNLLIFFILAPISGYKLFFMELYYSIVIFICIKYQLKMMSSLLTVNWNWNEKQNKPQICINHFELILIYISWERIVFFCVDNWYWLVFSWLALIKSYKKIIDFMWCLLFGSFF